MWGWFGSCGYFRIFPTKLTFKSLHWWQVEYIREKLLLVNIMQVLFAPREIYVISKVGNIEILERPIVVLILWLTIFLCTRNTRPYAPWFRDKENYFTFNKFYFCSLVNHLLVCIVATLMYAALTKLITHSLL